MLTFTMMIALSFLLVIYFMRAIPDDYEEYSFATVVAARNPFRESGPPANMAKLILMRQKIQSTNRKRRSSSHSRQAVRSFTQPTSARPKVGWMRFGRASSPKHH